MGPVTRFCLCSILPCLLSGPLSGLLSPYLGFLDPRLFLQPFRVSAGLFRRQEAKDILRKAQEFYGTLL